MARTQQAAVRTGRRPLIAGNWKMHLTHLEAIGLVQKIVFSLKPAELDAAEVVVVPPFTALRSVQTLVAGDKLGIGYGAQDLSAQDSGAYTGEVSGAMLGALACTYAVVGHSERRAYHAETDEIVAAKVRASLRHGLVPILCVGEGLEVRRAGGHVAHCTAQLDAALEGVSAEQVAGSLGAGGGIVVAYEPVWAIGTGEVATPEDAQEVCGAVRAVASSWPTSRSGRSARARWPRRRMRRRSAVHCGRGSPSGSGRVRARASVSSTAGR